MTLIRRFFSGPSLMQAVLAAARHHEVDPEDLAYEVIDKKHGFLKTPRGVVIEVDPERPTAATPQAPAPPAAAPVEPQPEPQPEPQSEAQSEAAPESEREPRAPRQRLEEMTEPVVPEATDSAPVASDAAPPQPPTPDPPQEEAPPFSDTWAAEQPPAAAPVAESPPLEPSAADPAPVQERPGAARLVDAEWAMPDATSPASPEPAPPSDPAPEEEAAEAKWWDAAPAPLEPRATAAPVGEPEAVEAPAPLTPQGTPAPGAAAADEAASGGSSTSPGETAEELDDDLRQAVAQAVDELVYLAGLRVQVASASEVDDGLAVELEGPDSRRVVAHGGRALLAIQHLLPRLLFNKLGRATHCRLDCEGFHAARGARLERLARKAAERVRAGGRSWLLEPMAPDERRLVHLALADEPDVETESVGEGYLKRVRVAQI